jgi:hypothetical protein
MRQRLFACSLPGKAFKTDALLGVCHRVPPNDDETAKTQGKRAGFSGYVYGYLYE